MRWFRRIRSAINRGYFLAQDRQDACIWESCMVSEKPGFKNEGEPRNERLRSLGYDFNDAVHNNNPYAALKIRKQILELEV